MDIITSNYRLYFGDCLERFKEVQDKSVDLELIDPPYNISKAEWDKWLTEETYEELRQEYEEQRYTFNVFDKDTTTTFLITPAKKKGI